jgi:hypothetical protein
MAQTRCLEENVRNGDFLSVLLRAAGLCAVLFAVQAGAAGKIFNVADFGAVGDGKTLGTRAIQKAIDAAGTVDGGIVEIPAGTFLTGPLQLRSGVTLQLDEGAILLGSRNVKDYYSASTNGADGKPVFHNLIQGEGLHDVTIRGMGTIDGNGDAFPDPHEQLKRPHNIFLDRCENVLVEGVRLRAAGSWMQHYKLCTNVVIRGIAVFNHATHNNDGLDINSSMNVTITDCQVDSDDDAICLKSTTGVPCRNVKISGCTCSSHCNALKMGTESGGGFVDITISNCTVFSPTNSTAINGTQRGEAGIALEIVDGGRLENVTVTDIKIRGVLAPIFLRLGDRGRPYATGLRPPVGSFRNVTLKNITAENCSPLGCAIAGLPDHPIENVLLENINLSFDGDGHNLEYAHKVFQPRNNSRGPDAGDDPANTKRPISERPAAYPGCTMFGILPAYGFYCRHVKDLRFDNVKLATAIPDHRHALMFDDAEAVSISGLDIAGSPDSAALLCLVQTRGATISGVDVRAPAHLLLQLQGEETKNIVLEKSNVQAVEEIHAQATGVPFDAFVQKP